MTENSSPAINKQEQHGDVLGPFLCKPSANSMGFWMAFKIKPKTAPIIHVLDQTGTIVDSVTLQQVSSIFETWIGETAKPLVPDSPYTYKIYFEESEQNRPWVENQRFRTFSSDAHKEIQFASMSCHGIDAWEAEHGQTESFKMWSVLNGRLDRHPITFAVLGGDQVYMDNAWEKHKDEYANLNLEYRIKTISEVYFQYWGNSEYQRALARTPAVLMWDDHDLNDGFGARLDSFDSNDELDKNWTQFKADLSTAFWCFQGVRNPGTFEFPEWSPTEKIDPNIKLKTNYTFEFKTAQLSLLGLDLRSERNALKHQLVSNTSREKILQSVQTNKSEAQFILSPVTFTRISGPIEEVLGNFANLMWQYTRWIGFGHSILKPFVWLLLFLICFMMTQSPATTKIAAGLLAVLGSSAFFPVRRGRKNKAMTGKALSTVRILCGLLLISAILGFLFGSDHLPLIEQLDAFAKVIRSTDTIFIMATAIISTLLLFWSSGISEKKKSKTISLAGWGCFALSFLYLQCTNLVQVTELGDYPTKLIIALLAQVFLVFTHLEASGAVDAVAGLDDDIKDAWSSETNANELRGFLNAIKTVEKPVYILSGDIHTGGLSQITIGAKKIPQITTSPISYVPMGAIVEKLTSSNKKLPLPAKEPVAMGENYFYISERNFGIVTLHSDKTVTSEFVYENHDSSIKVKLQDR